MHDQILNFQNQQTFRYQAHQAHLFINQHEKYLNPLHPVTQTEIGEVIPTIEWIPYVRRIPKSTKMCEYYNYFLSMLYSLIHEEPLPRILPIMRELLQLSPNTILGDWFFFEKNTLMRIYGYMRDPYMLPAFLTTRIFSLEYARQMIAMDDLHFVSKKATQMFKVPQ